MASARVLYTALAAVGLLLLIACCNVANMLLAQGHGARAGDDGAGGARRRPRADRAAVAGREPAARFEWGGARLSVGLCRARRARRLLPQTPLPGEVEIAMIARRSCSASEPLSRRRSSSGLRRRCTARAAIWSMASRRREGDRRRPRDLRNALVAAEIALSLVLLLSAGLLMRTFMSIVRVDLGFNPENILVRPARVCAGCVLRSRQRSTLLRAGALQRIAALPGVEAVAASSYVPPLRWALQAAIRHSWQRPAGASHGSRPVLY